MSGARVKDWLDAASRRQNGKDIGAKCAQSGSNSACKCILFRDRSHFYLLRIDRFRPLRRWRTLRYRHIAAARRLALNESASNLDAASSQS